MEKGYSSMGNGTTLAINILLSSWAYVIVYFTINGKENKI